MKLTHEQEKEIWSTALEEYKKRFLSSWIECKSKALKKITKNDIL